MDFFIGQKVVVEYIDYNYEDNGTRTGSGQLIKYIGTVEWLFWGSRILQLLKIKKPDGSFENVSPKVIKGFDNGKQPRFYNFSKWTQVFMDEDNPTCSCPAFMYSKERPKICKHIKLILEKQIERTVVSV